MKRGDIWVADLNPPRGREAGKIRPVLVLHANELIEAGSPMIIVLPLTTRLRPELQLLRLALAPRDRLRESSQIILDQPRALDRTRFGEGPLTILTADEMALVERGLRVSLGMY